ncbi:MAG: hypothetical protein RLZZ156_1084 [Deinococcota bacterium]|jgi:hypothetical protein
MIAERFSKTMSTDELSLYLCEAGLDGYLSKSEFEQIMAELKTRGLDAESLAVLSSFGQPEWRKGQIRFR